MAAVVVVGGPVVSANVVMVVVGVTIVGITIVGITMLEAPGVGATGVTAAEVRDEECDEFPQAAVTKLANATTGAAINNRAGFTGRGYRKPC
jgi:hypothetical protein